MSLYLFLHLSGLELRPRTDLTNTEMFLDSYCPIVRGSSVPWMESPKFLSEITSVVESFTPVPQSPCFFLTTLWVSPRRPATVERVPTPPFLRPFPGTRRTLSTQSFLPEEPLLTSFPPHGGNDLGPAPRVGREREEDGHGKSTDLGWYRVDLYGRNFWPRVPTRLPVSYLDPLPYSH